MNSGVKRLVLVIGGPYGFSEEVYKRSDARLSLSRMTFSHQIVRDVYKRQEQYVHSAYGLAVVVLLHVEGLDVLGIVDQDDGTLEMLLDQITLMLLSLIHI